MTDIEIYPAPYQTMTDRGETPGDACTADAWDGKSTWHCTRKKGHDGRHEAGAGMTKFASWGDPE